MERSNLSEEMLFYHSKIALSFLPTAANLTHPEIVALLENLGS